MSYLVHLFVTPSRSSPMEDLGKVSISPKPERGEMIEFSYKGKQATGMVALIDPYNWEKKRSAIPRVHVHMSGSG